VSGAVSGAAAAVGIGGSKGAASCASWRRRIADVRLANRRALRFERDRLVVLFCRGVVMPTTVGRAERSETRQWKAWFVGFRRWRASSRPTAKTVGTRAATIGPRVPWHCAHALGCSHWGSLPRASPLGGPSFARASPCHRPTPALEDDSAAVPCGWSGEDADFAPRLPGVIVRTSVRVYEANIGLTQAVLCIPGSMALGPNPSRGTQFNHRAREAPATA
jgi:hypothetical protein